MSAPNLHTSQRIAVFAAGLLAASAPAAALSRPAARYSLIIRSAVVYDGTGRAPFTADIALRGDRIARIGSLGAATASRIIDANGLAVAPGFTNLMSDSGMPLLVDGRAMSDVMQGITLDVMQEGDTVAPLNGRMAAALAASAPLQGHAVTWRTLDQYFAQLMRSGTAVNVASFVGATTVRRYVIGERDRAPTPLELRRMQQLVREGMEDGAVGVTAAIGYSPGSFAKPAELIALGRVAARFHGVLACHLRNYTTRLQQAVAEFIRIVSVAHVRGHIYHLVVAGKDNWATYAGAIARIEAARRRGVVLTSDMHPYTAGGDSLSTLTPTWTRDGGTSAFIARLTNPPVRARIVAQIEGSGANWDNLYRVAGPDHIFVAGLPNPADRRFVGKSLAEIAALQGRPPIDAALDLLVENRGVGSLVCFYYSEDNVREAAALPWVAVMTDSPPVSPGNSSIDEAVHPRAYGSFPRFIAKYVRGDRVVTWQEAIRRMTSLPADIIGARHRGRLRAGYYADLVIFDPKTFRDRATYRAPHRYPEGIREVLVNGEPVVKDGAFTGRLPGRVVRGPGWRGWAQAEDPARHAAARAPRQALSFHPSLALRLPRARLLTHDE